MKVECAPSVSALARELSLSRQWTTELFRLPDHPKPTKAGHNVAKWKEWLAARAEKHESTAGEKSRLELELLRKRITREDMAIAALDNSVREEIVERVTAECKQVVDLLFSRLQRLPNELAGVLSTLGDEPQEIFKRLKADISQRFETARDELEKIQKQSRRKDNLVPFNSAKANGNGAIALNGANRA